MEIKPIELIMFNTTAIKGQNVNKDEYRVYTVIPINVIRQLGIKKGDILNIGVGKTNLTSSGKKGQRFKSVKHE